MSSILECIRTVGRGERGRKPLSFEQAYRIMDEYLSGEVGDDQMAMLLMLIRVQNETNEEIAGFVKAFQSRVPDLGADIDWPCYAGKRNDTASGKPWNLLAAKILADDGYKVLMHGYMDKPSGRTHAETHLDLVGVRRAVDPQDAKQILEEDGIAYLPLANFAPEAQTMIGWKHRYGLRTPINTVVRALNPGGGRLGLRGSFHPGFPQLHAEVEHVIGNKSHSVISFKGMNGESEYNPKVSQTVWMSSPEKVESFYWEGTMNPALPLPKECVLGTPEDEMESMANSVVDSMMAILFAETHDKAEAYAKALRLWEAYCAR
ncbi:glycosyl transferase family protein [Vibrio cyclitrophicus]|uniref:glycosyl transferase family protein n=1 Tax=Vibrio cyclitrophicus TaxID=47951 RepID=UPI000C85E91F|nr:glycosyl transferase family protein [Vibrio cyclitrophicus]MCC4775247.1 glycosyl transferase family protein [Vibrio cyclitrophicus]MCC4840322.1 glycosyl transferase family protein [Vibrio cyclitrophicus]PME09638.1 glycosyl transferase [Vibrio cyclitrophicus]PME49358.1 glycosyl transferase [Vibrio cyclitrophicus]PME76255.1 glycosyl transferase [Vibrio cyclitrophicus]